MDGIGMKNGQDALVDPLAPKVEKDRAKKSAKKPDGPEPAREPDRPNEPGPRFTVAMINKEAKDSRGKPIDDVFFKRDAYAIYQSEKQMAIQFADDAKEASAQIRDVSPLLPLRNKIQFMCSDYPRFNCYRLQIAEALHLALDGRADQGRRLMNVVLEDCENMRACRARRCYVKHAFITAVLIMVAVLVSIYSLFYVTEAFDSTVRNGLTLMLLAITGGAIGALLSIAIAIRGRAVELDGDLSANRLDARVRIAIGVISAGALYLILAAGLFKLEFGEVKLTGTEIDWGMALLIGVAAGFLERLVPNLLEGRREPSSRTAEAGTDTQAG